LNGRTPPPSAAKYFRKSGLQRRLPHRTKIRQEHGQRTNFGANYALILGEMKSPQACDAKKLADGLASKN